MTFIGWLQSLFKPTDSDRVKKLEELLAETQSQLTESNRRLNDCSAEKSLLLYEYDQAKRTIDYMQDQIANYSTIMAEMAPVPKFKNYTQTAEEYDPWNDQNQPPTLFSIYDHRYLTFTENEWLKQLDVVYKIVKQYGGAYIPDVWDCENYAWLAYSIYARGCKEAELKYQGCFGWARSHNHAYNVFRLKDDRWMVWEPQNRKVVGELGSTPKPYETIRIKI